MKFNFDVELTPESLRAAGEKLLDLAKVLVALEDKPVKSCHTNDKPTPNVQPDTLVPGEVVTPVALPTTTINTTELDSRGIPWDSRIHSEKKTMTKKGEWKNRRNTDKALIEQVTNELLAVPPQAIPAVPPQATPAVPPQATPAVPPQATPAVPPQATPAVPPQATPAVPPSASVTDIARKAMTLPTEVLDSIAVEMGLTTHREVYTKPELYAPFMQKLLEVSP